MSGLQPRRAAACSWRHPLRLPFPCTAALLWGLFVAACSKAPRAAAAPSLAGAASARGAAGAARAPGGGPAPANGTAEAPAVVISSWVVISVYSRGAEPLDKSVLPALTAGVRGALADVLEVCRPAVSVHSMRSSAFGGGASDVSLLAAGQRWPRRAASLADRAEKIVRRAYVHEAMHPTTRFSQVEVTYEVRIDDSIGASDAEVAHRIDSLQLYSKFADLNLLLLRWLDGTPAPQGILELGLSDLGYASRRKEVRQVFSAEQTASCMEEGMLRRAKQNHQYVIVSALAMSVLIACVGSLVFAVKVPSHIPSMMNPLSPPPDQ